MIQACSPILKSCPLRLRKLGTVCKINLLSPYIRSHVSFWWGLIEGSYAIIINFCYEPYEPCHVKSCLWKKKLVFTWCDPYVEYKSCRTHLLKIKKKVLYANPSYDWSHLFKSIKETRLHFEILHLHMSCAIGKPVFSRLMIRLNTNRAIQGHTKDLGCTFYAAK